MLASAREPAIVRVEQGPDRMLIPEAIVGDETDCEGVTAKGATSEPPVIISIINIKSLRDTQHNLILVALRKIQ